MPSYSYERQYKHTHLLYFKNAKLTQTLVTLVTFRQAWELGEEIRIEVRFSKRFCRFYFGNIKMVY